MRIIIEGSQVPLRASRELNLRLEIRGLGFRVLGRCHRRECLVSTLSSNILKTK